MILFKKISESQLGGDDPRGVVEGVTKGVTTPDGLNFSYRR